MSVGGANPIAARPQKCAMPAIWRIPANPANPCTVQPSQRSGLVFVRRSGATTTATFRVYRPILGGVTRPRFRARSFPGEPGNGLRNEPSQLLPSGSRAERHQSGSRSPPQSSFTTIDRVQFTSVISPIEGANTSAESLPHARPREPSRHRLSRRESRSQKAEVTSLSLRHGGTSWLKASF